MSYRPTPTQNEDSAASSGFSAVPIIGVRQDAETSPVSTDGDFHPFLFNALGRLKTAGAPALFDPIVDDITSIGDTVVADVTQVSNIMAHCYGTFSTINCIFEGSLNSTDGSDGNWFTIQAVRTSANTVETTTGNLSASPAYGWEFSVNALSWFRIRCTARSSGTQSWVVRLGSYATEPIPAIQTHAVTGSGNFAVTMAANATTTPAKARDGAAGASDTGIPAFFVRRDTPTSVTPAAGDFEIAQIDAQGAQWVREKSSATTSVANVSSSATNVTILASNTARRGATIYNDSTQVLYLKLGATATSSSFTVKMQPDSYYEVPAFYTGVIDGIWASANGAARVTEISV